MRQTSIIPFVFKSHVFRIFFAAAAFIAVSGLFLSASSAEPTVYALDVSTSGPGSISPSGTIPVAEGGRQSFVFDAGDENHIADVIVDGVSIGPVAAFSFENITGSHTLEAVFQSDATELTMASERNAGNGSAATYR